MPALVPPTPAVRRNRLPAPSGDLPLRQRAIESAQQAADYVISQVAQAEEVWRSALSTLCKKPTGDDAERLLRVLLDKFESAQQSVRSARDLWEVARQLGAAPERLDELDHAEGRFKELADETKVALEHRASDWQPTDPARLALGLRLAREGKTVKADEARTWFRRGRG
jgi:hypothetical protein